MIASPQVSNLIDKAREIYTNQSNWESITIESQELVNKTTSTGIDAMREFAYAFANASPIAQRVCYAAQTVCHAELGMDIVQVIGMTDKLNLVYKWNGRPGPGFLKFKPIESGLTNEKQEAGKHRLEKLSSKDPDPTKEQIIGDLGKKNEGQETRKRKRAATLSKDSAPANTGKKSRVVYDFHFCLKRVENQAKNYPNKDESKEIAPERIVVIAQLISEGKCMVNKLNTIFTFLDINSEELNNVTEENLPDIILEILKRNPEFSGHNPNVLKLNEPINNVTDLEIILDGGVDKFKVNDIKVKEMLKNSRVFEKHTASSKSEAYKLSMDRYEAGLGSENWISKETPSSVLVDAKDKRAKEFLTEHVKKAINSNLKNIADKAATIGYSKQCEMTLEYEIPGNISKPDLYDYDSNGKYTEPSYSKLNITLVVFPERVNAIEHCVPE